MRMHMRARSVFGGLLMAAAALVSPGIAQAAGNSGSFGLTAHSMHSPYAPTFTGNGLLGIRVPPAGQGYAAGTVPAQSELAGFYAQPDKARRRPSASSSAPTSPPGRR